MAVVQVVVDRQQFDRRDAQVAKVADDGLATQPGIGAAEFLGHFRVELGKALDVHLVDDRLVPGSLRRPVVAPSEGFVDDRRQRREGGAVPLVERQVGLRVAELVAPDVVRPLRLPGNALGIRVEQHLVRVEAVAVLRLVGPMTR